ncbi:MAG: cytidine deaminase [Clostridia bacterium]|nr:cytidine deaminase [Clostridia bacterium]
MKYPIKEAFEAQKNAYAPYSKFFVGAALLCGDGRVYKGCNIENSSYPVTICAERVVIGNAIADGNRDFKAIVITGGDDYCYPCGMCRQTLAEFCDGDFRVVLAKSENEIKVYKLSELLPESFVLDK